MAQNGYKVRSQPGHHVKILEKLAELTGEEDIMTLGNKMRQDRNKDFYEGGAIVTDKETEEYLTFVQGVAAKAKLQLE